MKRHLSYPADITATVAGPPHLYVPLSIDGIGAPDAAARLADMAKTIPWNTVQRAVRLFAAAGGQALSLPPFVDGNAVVIPLPAAAVAEPWRAAVLLNLVDFSAASDDEDLRLIHGASLRAPALSGVTVDAAFTALEAQLSTARAAMTKHLPKGFKIDDYGEGWPDVADSYDFDIIARLSRALTAAEAAYIAALAEDGEMITAWMAFATEGSAQAWVDAGHMVYSGETSAKGSILAWNASRPPTDFAPALLLVEAALSRLGVRIKAWDITIQAGL